MVKAVKDFVEVSPFRPYIDFSVLEVPVERIKVLKDYVITPETEKYIRTFLEAITDIRKEGKKTFLVAGSYGTGKSYFLVFSSLMLESLFDPELFKLMRSKLKEKRGIWRRVMQLQEKNLRLLPVRIDLKQESKAESIRGIIISHIKQAVKKYLDKELVLPYEYEEILKAIRDAKPEDKSRLEEAVKARGYGLEQLEDMLERRRYEGIRIFVEAYTAVFPLPPEIPAPPMSGIVDQTLKNLKKDFDGLVFFIDELQKYLEGSPLMKVEDDLFTLEALSEATTGRHIIVIPSVLEPQLALKYPWGRTYDKYTSRFESLSLSLEGLDEIVRSRLIFSKELRSELRRNEAVSVLTRENFESLCKLYPLNPVSFRFLKQIAQIRAAERSAFTFISSACEKIMNQSFIGVDDKPTLITPDFLYDYFEADLANIFREIVDEVRSLLTEAEEEEKRYLKYMGIATSLENQFKRNDLSQALLERDDLVRTLMSKIIGIRPGIFLPIKLGEIYAIRPIAGRVRDIISELKEQIEDPLRNLVVKLSHDNMHVTTWKVDLASRNISVRFSLVDTADKVLEQSHTKEIRLLVVVPATRINFKDARTLSLIDKAGDSNILVFVVEQKLTDIELLKQYFAAKLAVEQRRLAEKEVEAIISNTTILFRELFKAENLSVWYQGRKIPKRADLISIEDGLVVNRDFMEEVLTKAFRKLYPTYSELRKKFRGEIDLSTRRFTNDIIKGFFAREPIDATRITSTVKYVQNLAEPLGLAKKEAGEYHFSTPPRGIQGKVWTEIKETIEEKPNSSHLYSFLSGKGLPDALIDLYLAALIKSKQVSVLDKDRRYIRFDPRKPNEFLKNVQQIVKDSSKGVDCYITLAKPFPRKRWSLIREFLSEIMAEPVDILKQAAIAEDQVYDVWELMTQELTSYQTRLSSLNSFLEDLESKLLRIRRKPGSGRGGIS